MPQLRFSRPRLLLLLIAMWALAAMPAAAADISVDDDCTLRDAITAANLDAAQGECPAGSGTDTITITVDVTLDGVLPTISEDLSIVGEADGDFTVSGNDAGGIFVIDSASLTITDLTVTEGLAQANGGAFYVDEGSLTLTRVEVEDNQASDSGGGIYANDSNVTLISTTIKNNVAKRGGGAGIFFAGTTGTHSLTITSSVFTGNGASQDGGGIHAAGGTVTIKKSGFQSNTADEGGVIEIWNGDLVMHNTTLNSNSAREGGAINAGADTVSTGSVELIHNTFTSNSAVERGGAVAMTGVNASLRIGNTWISGTLPEGVLHCDPGVSPYTILGNVTNYIQDNSCPRPPASTATPTATPTPDPDSSAQSAQLVGEVVEVEAQSAAEEEEFSAQDAAEELQRLRLGALREIEGVIYHPLLQGSRAINAADQDLCEQLDNPDDDVVNTRRPQGDACDIGAFELPVPTPTSPPESPPPAPQATNTPSAPAPTPTPMKYLCPGLPDGYRVVSNSPNVRCEVVVIADIDKHPLMNAGVEQTLDIRGEVEAGTEFCFHGAGSLVFEDDSVSPALASRLPLYSANDMNCAQVPKGGRVTHVAALTDDQAIPLRGCSVTTTNVARLRDAPGGSNVQALTPFNVTLPASARTANWFLVEYLGRSGWISAALLQTEGACD